MSYGIKRLGWLPDPPDFRDWKVRHRRVQARLAELLPLLKSTVDNRRSTGRRKEDEGRQSRACHEAPPTASPLRVDLRPWCSPVEDQGDIGSCTAQAVVGALEYFERRTRRAHVDASRLFLYKVTRRYLGWSGDSGAFIRSAIKALRLFGACPEAHWPYDPTRFDAEPEPFHYALAQNFKALEYFRLDGTPDQLRSALDAGLPFVFGFTCFSSLFRPEVSRTGVIPFPGPGESVLGGHAVLAVGYGDSHVLIRNSWGPGWGAGGHGYLPWTYFDSSHALARDAWALVNAEWVPPEDIDFDDGVAGAPSRRRASMGPRRTALSLPAPVPAAPRPPDGTPGPVLKVVMGEDPIRAVPLRFTPRGIAAARGAAPALATTPGPVSLSLRSLSLNASFDFSLFRRAANELYFTALTWDLSGSPPVIYPPADLESGPAIHRLRVGERRVFVGDGILLWPPRPVTGALYARVIVFESDGGLRAAGKALLAIRRAIEGSPLLGALAALAGGAVPAGTLAAAGAAADILAGTIAGLLARDGDDLVELFEGAYGADRALSTRLESYDHQGASLELEFRGMDAGPRTPRGPASLERSTRDRSRR